MRNLPCPQCDIHRFHVKNHEGQFLVVTVNENYEVVPIHAGESLDGFDLSIITFSLSICRTLHTFSIHLNDFHRVALNTPMFCPASNSAG